MTADQLEKIIQGITAEIEGGILNWGWVDQADAPCRMFLFLQPELCEWEQLSHPEGGSTSCFGVSDLVNDAGRAEFAEFLKTAIYDNEKTSGILAEIIKSKSDLDGKSYLGDEPIPENLSEWAYYWAVYFSASEHFDAARHLFEMAVESTDHIVEKIVAGREIGFMYQKSSDWDRAIAHFKCLLEQDYVSGDSSVALKLNAILHQDIGANLSKKGMEADAAEWLSSQVQKSEIHEQTLLWNLARCHCLSGNLDAAKEALERLANKEPLPMPKDFESAVDQTIFDPIALWTGGMMGDVEGREPGDLDPNSVWSRAMEDDDFEPISDWVSSKVSLL
ncbi:MAG: hypothetical protein ABGY96_01070 [bacterium]